jgi:hypothetical protein
MHDVIQLSDQIFVTVFLSLWFLFPVGLFISVGQVDKNTVHPIDLNVVRKDTDKAAAGKRFTLNPTADRKPKFGEGLPT